MKRAIALKINFVAVWKLKKIESDQKVSVYICKVYILITKTFPLDHHILITQFRKHHTGTLEEVHICHFLS